MCIFSKLKCGILCGSTHLVLTSSPDIVTLCPGARLDEGLHPAESGNGPFYCGGAPSFSEISVVLHHLDPRTLLREWGSEVNPFSESPTVLVMFSLIRLFLSGRKKKFCSP